jgi:ribosomal protein L37AE/L43A
MEFNWKQLKNLEEDKVTCPDCGRKVRKEERFKEGCIYCYSLW